MIYRDMVKRSYPQVAKVLGKTERSVTQVAGRWKWGPRALEWDNELDKRMREAQLDEVDKMVRRQTGIGVDLQEVAAMELQALGKRIKHLEKVAAETNQIRKPLLAARDIVRLVDSGTKLERINRGEPTEITRNEGESLTEIVFVDADNVDDDAES